MSETFTLLTYPQRSTLVFTQGYSRTRNMPYNTTRKTIYKGVDSTLGFDIKNQDRKPINLLGKSIMVNIMNVRTGKLLFQRRAVLLDPTSGFCEVTVFSSDLIDQDTGIYQLSAIIYDESGTAKALYSDNNRRASMEIELVDGAYPSFVPSIDLVFSQLGDTWLSQALPGNMQKNDTGLLHTVQIRVNNFKGTVQAMASLEYNSEGSYFPIRFINDSLQIKFSPPYDLPWPDGDRWPNSTVEGWNFSTNARWIKIMYRPDVDNTGTIDRVIYRS